MDNQIWSWVLGAIGVTGFVLVGQKIWWAWYINIANQVIWTAYSVITQQWGFLVVTAVYVVVFCKNAHRWTKDHFEEKKAEQQSHILEIRDPLGYAKEVWEDGRGGISVKFVAASQQAEQNLRNMFKERAADANSHNRKQNLD